MGQVACPMMTFAEGWGRAGPSSMSAAWPSGVVAPVAWAHRKGSRAAREPYLRVTPPPVVPDSVTPDCGSLHGRGRQDSKQERPRSHASSPSPPPCRCAFTLLSCLQTQASQCHHGEDASRMPSLVYCPGATTMPTAAQRPCGQPPTLPSSRR
eukprot:SM000002S05796  [mRNA]  locus=s2:2192091:2192940:- [translate_table: standard]